MTGAGRRRTKSAGVVRRFHISKRISDEITFWTNGLRAAVRGGDVRDDHLRFRQGSGEGGSAERMDRDHAFGQRRHGADAHRAGRTGGRHARAEVGARQPGGIYLRRVVRGRGMPHAVRFRPHGRRAAHALCRLFARHRADGRRKGGARDGGHACGRDAAQSQPYPRAVQPRGDRPRHPVGDRGGSLRPVLRRLLRSRFRSGARRRSGRRPRLALQRAGLHGEYRFTERRDIQRYADRSGQSRAGLRDRAAAGRPGFHADSDRCDRARWRAVHALHVLAGGDRRCGWCSTGRRISG